ncbi:MAG: response regulator transcription factor [Gemmatimonadales bacterium]|jgi:two-component system copper resistance phosphate regulon response regulator CusR
MRLLVVEDDPQLGAVLARGLRERTHAVDLVRDGDDAVLHAALHEYDAVVLDYMLPRRDGIAVARALRARGLQTPILMLTARDAVVDRVAGLDAGADDYLVKPFVFDELLARLRALTRRAGAVTPSIIMLGDLAIDTRAQRVAKRGVTVPLTAKEYALLEFLARHRGALLSRADITAHVWDENHDPASNTLEVYINRLRRKIDDAAAPSHIQTRRGAGYTFDLPSGSPDATT